MDPERLNIPDYFEVVQHPMDFGTIRNKLNTNAYHAPQEFLHDMNLVFENCMNYNGEDSHVGKKGKVVGDEFRK